MNIFLPRGGQIAGSPHRQIQGRFRLTRHRLAANTADHLPQLRVLCNQLTRLEILLSEGRNQYLTITRTIAVVDNSDLPIAIHLTIWIRNPSSFIQQKT